MCIFESDTIKSDCPMQENYKIHKDLIQAVGLLYQFNCPLTLNLKKKLPVNQLIKKYGLMCVEQLHYFPIIKRLNKTF